MCSGMVCSSCTTSGTRRVTLKRQEHNLIWKFDLLRIRINIKYIKLNICIYRLVSFCSYYYIVIIIIQNETYVVHRQDIADHEM